jgi:hypothetical protein
MPLPSTLWTLCATLLAACMREVPVLPFSRAIQSSVRCEIFAIVFGLQSVRPLFDAARMGIIRWRTAVRGFLADCDAQLRGGFGKAPLARDPEEGKEFIKVFAWHS